MTLPARYTVASNAEIVTELPSLPPSARQLYLTYLALGFRDYGGFGGCVPSAAEIQRRLKLSGQYAALYRDLLADCDLICYYGRRPEAGIVVLRVLADAEGAALESNRRIDEKTTAVVGS